MTITIYTKPCCGPCIATKVAFQARRIPFIEISTQGNPDAEATVRKLGYRSMPVVVVGPDRHWGGDFRLDLINELSAELALTDSGEADG